MNEREIAAAKTLWQNAVSQDLPPEQSFHIWSRSFTFECLSEAILQTGRKRRYAEKYRAPMDINSLARYCSSCARNARDYERTLAEQSAAVSSGV